MRNADSQVSRLVALQTNNGLVDHAHRPRHVAKIAKQPACGGQLNQSFEKGLVLFPSPGIKILERLVRFEETAGIEQTYALSQPSIHTKNLDLKLTTSPLRLKGGLFGVSNLTFQIANL